MCSLQDDPVYMESFLVLDHTPFNGQIRKIPINSSERCNMFQKFLVLIIRNLFFLRPLIGS